MAAMQSSIVHSDQDGTYTAANSSGEEQGWQLVRHWIENEEDTEMSQVQIAALGAELQQFVSEYQWHQAQYQNLKQDYQIGLQLLTGASTAPQAPKGQ